LEDVLVRRSGWHYYHHAMPKAVEQVATWMAEMADWSPARRSAELETYFAVTKYAPAA
jgi:glycerol-3-phosphate dehydrogenase